MKKATEWLDEKVKSVALEKTKTKPVLAPAKHIQRDFFVADLCDVAMKDDIASMEHPLFALKAGDTKVREYQRARGNEMLSVKVMPGTYGCATIDDKDVWIYCISQLVEAQNRGRAISRTVHFTAYDFLVTTERDTSGRSYERMASALERLAGTRIETNIETHLLRERAGFGLIDSWRVVEEKNGRMVAVEVTLPNWLYRSIEAKAVLTLSHDYFRIRKPLHRRVYELARKHCGAQKKWQCTLETLYAKSGSREPLRNFRVSIRELCEAADLPDYSVSSDGAMVFFVKK